MGQALCQACHMHADEVEGLGGAYAFRALQTTQAGNSTAPHSTVHRGGGQRERQQQEKELFSLSTYLSSSASTLPYLSVNISSWFWLWLGQK